MAKNLIDMFNLALVRAGSPTIVSPTEEGNKADMCRRLYPEARDEVLRMYDWPSVIKRVNLAKITSTDLDQYVYAYQLPSDCVKVIITIPESNYVIESGKLYSDTDNLAIKYSMGGDDPTTYDDLLFKCISLNLAAQLTIYLIQKPALNQVILQQLAATIPSAMNEAGIEGKKTTKQNLYWDEMS